jgi:hypothetical protein
LFRIGTDGGLLWMRWWTFVFCRHRFSLSVQDTKFLTAIFCNPSLLELLPRSGPVNFFRTVSAYRNLSEHKYYMQTILSGYYFVSTATSKLGIILISTTVTALHFAKDTRL